MSTSPSRRVVGVELGTRRILGVLGISFAPFLEIIESVVNVARPALDGISARHSSAVALQKGLAPVRIPPALG